MLATVPGNTAAPDGSASFPASHGQYEWFRLTLRYWQLPGLWQSEANVVSWCSSLGQATCEYVFCKVAMPQLCESMKMSIKDLLESNAVQQLVKEQEA